MAELEWILDECIEQIRSGHDPEDVLKQYPQVADEIRPLLLLTQELESLPTPVPSAHGMMRTMARLSLDSKRNGRLVRGLWPGPFSWPTLARAAVIVFVLLGVSWGTITASAGSAPGDLLYPIKVFTERVKLYLTINPENKAELRILFSGERLKEAIKLYQKGYGVKEDLLKAMLEEARLAVETSANLSDGSGVLLVAQAANLSDYQQEVLQQLTEKAPPAEQQELAPWVNMCGQRARWMRRLINDVGITDVDKRQNHPEKVNRWMKQCPPCW